jgi:membrane protease YdiL (CAAX protease family)
MKDPGRLPANGKTALVEVAGCLSGIFLFAFFIQRDSALQYFAYAGILLAAWMMSRTIRDLSTALQVFGISLSGRRILFYSLAGLVLGSLLALLSNYLREEHLFPPVITWFAALAPLIGIAEELVFRGYVQSRLAVTGSLFSIVLASAGHTCYKYLVIKTVPGDLPVNYASLVLLTFVVGVVFGILRDRSKSILPAAMAHAVFDIIIYGGQAAAPVWVWS